MEMQIDDRQLIARVLAGSMKDYGVLLRRHVVRVHGFVGRMVTNAEDAEELTQNVFAKAYAHLADYDEERSAFVTWLQRIAYHEAIDHLRRSSEERLLSLDDDDADWQVADECMADEPFDDMRTERIELLRKAVLTLPKDDQMLLHLRYNDGKTLADIGFILDRQPDYLATRLQRIRKRLHKLIKQMEYHEKE